MLCIDNDWSSISSDDIIHIRYIHHHMGLDTRKPTWLYATNKGADQPVHSGSLISTFVIHLLKSTIVKLLVYVAQPAGLSFE